MSEGNNKTKQIGAIKAVSALEAQVVGALHSAIGAVMAQQPEEHRVTLMQVIASLDVVRSDIERDIRRTIAEAQHKKAMTGIQVAQAMPKIHRG